MVKMSNEEKMNSQRKLTAAEIESVMRLCDRYLYLKEKTEGLYEKLTICGNTLGGARNFDPHSKERVMAIYAQAKEECQNTGRKLSLCRKRLCRIIHTCALLSPDEKQTLLLRIGKAKTIREIARYSQKSDAAIVKRIKTCGVKLCDDKALSKPFYDCLSCLQQTGKEEP